MMNPYWYIASNPFHKYTMHSPFFKATLYIYVILMYVLLLESRK